MTVPVAAVRIAAELLLVFPKDDLGRHLIIIFVDTGNRKACAGFPAVDRRQGNAPSGLGGEQVQVLAVRPAF